jgi:hypothetical protein
LTSFAADATDLLQKLSLDPKTAAGEGKDAKKKVRLAPLSVQPCLVTDDVIADFYNSVILSEFGDGAGLGSSERWAEWRGGIA